jgi:hypothetical protein
MKTIKNFAPTSQRKPTTKQEPPNFRYIHKVMQEKNNTEQSSDIEKATWSKYHTSALNKKEAEKYKYYNTKYWPTYQLLSCGFK